MSGESFLTFVVGAGGSIPYGFPTWKNLYDRLLDESMVPVLRRATLHNSRVFTEKEIVDFQKALSTATHATIDEFLHDNQQFMRVGMYGVAHIISECESEFDLRRSGDGRWYGQFFDKLFYGMSGKELPSLLVNIRIVSFNYDRSMEMFLWNRLRQSCHPVELSNAISECFVHPYGKIGNYPWHSRMPRDYSASSMNANESEFSELPSDSMTILNPDTWRYRLSYSEQSHVYFLGFGFHDANMTAIALGPRKFTSPAPLERNMNLDSVQFSGTCLKLPSHVKKKWAGLGMDLLDMDICSFLDKVRFPQWKF